MSVSSIELEKIEFRNAILMSPQTHREAPKHTRQQEQRTRHKIRCQRADEHAAMGCKMEFSISCARRWQQ